MLFLKCQVYNKYNITNIYTSWRHVKGRYIFEDDVLRFAILLKYWSVRYI